MIAEAVFGLAILAGFYMAWNIGANDVANAMGTSVASGALTIRKAIILAGIFEFCGAFFVGSNVAQTIRRGIVPVDAFLDNPQALAIGMLSALIAAAVWLNIATFFSQPVSTTHAIVGAVVGFAIVSVGPGEIHWAKLGSIAVSWVVSPISGGLLAYLIYRLIRRVVLQARHPVFMARRSVPLAFGAVTCILCLSIVYKGLPRLRLDWPLAKALPISVLVGLAMAGAARLTMRRWTRDLRYTRADRYALIERWFSRIQIVTACFLAFAHGANDVANAIGPVAGVLHLLRGGEISAQMPVPTWLLAFGGVGIVIGLGTYGYKVIETIGRKITEITPTRGFAAEFGTATTVLVCSKLGLPISTTLVLVGAVMGVGLARGFGAIDLKVIRRIFMSWVITIPACAVLAALIYGLLGRLFC